jgi:hypothetical protein
VQPAETPKCRIECGEMTRPTCPREPTARSRSCHQSHPLRSGGKLLEHDGLLALKPEHVAERSDQPRAAVLHSASIATEDHDVVAAVNERAGTAAKRSIAASSREQSGGGNSSAIGWRCPIARPYHAIAALVFSARSVSYNS